MDGFSAGRVLGPLAPYADGFVVELVERGYRPRSVSGQLELMAHLSRWLGEQGVEPGGLTPGMADRFLEVRRAGRCQLEELAGARSAGGLSARARGGPEARGFG